MKKTRTLWTLIAFAVAASAQPVMTNQTVEAMLRGGVPIPTILTAIKTATYIQLFTSKEFHDRLLKAGASPSVADQIVHAMHDRSYNGADRFEDVKPLPVALAPPPVVKAAVAQPVETPVPVVTPSPPAAVPTPGERNWNVAEAKQLATLPLYATVEHAPSPIAVPAVAPGPPRLGADRRLYVSPMEGNLDGFIAAEIIKEHLPVQIVLDDNDVDLVLVGQSLKEDDH